MEVRCHCGRVLGHKEPLHDRRITTGICANCFEAEHRDNARRLALVKAAFGSIENFMNDGNKPWDRQMQVLQHDIQRQEDCPRCGSDLRSNRCPRCGHCDCCG